jgi:dTDP-4-dehydrorhamnose 3,5-epimerase
MKLVKTDLPEVFILEPDVFRDRRGFFMESFQADKYAEFNVPREFAQDNFTRSMDNVIRGLHGQVKNPQGKLIRVIQGEIMDVAVDMRVGSPRFGQWTGQILSDENYRAMYIPPGFFHGFVVRRGPADLLYKCTVPYDPKDEIGVRWDDPDLKIKWNVTSPLLSDRDLNLPLLKDIRPQLPSYASLALP